MAPSRGAWRRGRTDGPTRPAVTIDLDSACPRKSGGRRLKALQLARLGLRNTAISEWDIDEAGRLRPLMTVHGFGP